MQTGLKFSFFKSEASKTIRKSVTVIAEAVYCAGIGTVA